MEPYNLTGLILAGGDSRRMGRPKAGLDLGGKPLLDHVLKSLEQVCREVLIVTKRPADFLDFRVRVVRDLVAGQGPLGGLATGLFYTRRPWVLAIACDLPFLSTRLLSLIAEQALEARPGPRAIVPRTIEGWQPLIAAYHQTCLAPARRLLAQGGRKIDELRTFGVKWREISEEQLRSVDQDLKSFTNVNTPSDLDKAQEMVNS